MKIFVTGISGFVGNKLKKFFSPSDEIYVLARTPLKTGLEGLKVTVILGDLNMPQPVLEELKRIRPEACIHLAWEGIPDFSYEMSKRNLEQGAVLLRCLIEECGCRKIIVGGSCFEYGKGYGACHENDAVVTNSYLSWAKHALYDLGTLLASKNLVSFVWFRFFYVYGPGQRSGSLIPTLADALMRNKLPMIKTPLNGNDFIYVDDVAEALVLAARKEIATGVYNLGTGESTPVWKVCGELETALGRQPLRSIELKNTKAQITADYWSDISKTRSALGWKARTPLAEGIKHYLENLETV